MIVLPGDQIDTMMLIMNEILTKPQTTVERIKKKYNLTSEEYKMIFDLTMPFIRKHVDGNAYKQRYYDLRRNLSDAIHGDKSPTAHTVRKILRGEFIEE